MQLKDKIVLVTGAASGLGAATALACAREGANVMLVDRGAASLSATEAEIKKHGGLSGSFVGDLAERQTCIDAVNSAIERFGALDGLCNVAGIMKFHRLANITEQDWNKVLAVNLSAPFYLCQAAMPELIKRRGSVVNVASAGGIKSSAYMLAYASGKAALIHMTKCLAAEFINEPVRINAIAPGAMITNILPGGLPEGLDPTLLAPIRGIRPSASPADAANTIVYMLSDAVPSLHGSVVSVDGGVTAL